MFIRCSAIYYVTRRKFTMPIAYILRINNFMLVTENVKTINGNHVNTMLSDLLSILNNSVYMAYNSL